MHFCCHKWAVKIFHFRYIRLQCIIPEAVSYFVSQVPVVLKVLLTSKWCLHKSSMIFSFFVTRIPRLKQISGSSCWREDKKVVLNPALPTSFLLHSSSPICFSPTTLWGFKSLYRHRYLEFCMAEQFFFLAFCSSFSSRFCCNGLCFSSALYVDIEDIHSVRHWIISFPGNLRLSRKRARIWLKCQVVDSAISSPHLSPGNVPSPLKASHLLFTLPVPAQPLLWLGLASANLPFP